MRQTSHFSNKGFQRAFDSIKWIAQSKHEEPFATRPSPAALRVVEHLNPRIYATSSLLLWTEWPSLQDTFPLAERWNYPGCQNGRNKTQAHFEITTIVNAKSYPFPKPLTLRRPPEMNVVSSDQLLDFSLERVQCSTRTRFGQTRVLAGRAMSFQEAGNPSLEEATTMHKSGDGRLLSPKALPGRVEVRSRTRHARGEGCGGGEIMEERMTLVEDYPRYNHYQPFTPSSPKPQARGNTV